MKARPILFSGPMIRALLDGRKTQTRRPMNVSRITRDCPYGKPGELLWVRESWRTLQRWDRLPPRNIVDDPSKITFEADPENRNVLWSFGKLRPSLFMPRWASRLTLEITGVRVELLHVCSEADALAEGAEPDRPYGTIWKQINGQASWDANPWVWVLEFKVHRQNVDALLSVREAA